MCAYFVGDYSKIAVFHESGTYSSKLTSGVPFWPGLVQSHDVSEEQNVKLVRFAGNANRNVGRFVTGAYDAKGKISTYPQDWNMLMFALGSQVDGGSPSPYTHVISEVNSNVGNYATSGTKNPFISFTVEDTMENSLGDGFADQKLINGCIVDDFTISWSEGEPITCDIDYIGQYAGPGSKNATSVSDPGTRPFMSHDVKLHIPSGTVIAGMKDGSLSIKNNLVARHYQNGSRQIELPIPTVRNYEFSTTIDKNTESFNSLYRNYFQSGNTFNALLEITAVDAGAGSRDCFIVMSGCRSTKNDANLSIDDVNEQSITFNPQTINASVNDANFKYNGW